MKAYSITDIGKKRSMNQDYVYASDQPVGNLKNLLIVADGMGGHNAGDLASRYTVQEMLAYIKESEEDRPVPLLSMAIHHANEQVLEKAESEKELEGMGTTLVAATVQDEYLYVANVGDSRLYLIDDGIEQDKGIGKTGCSNIGSLTNHFGYEISDHLNVKIIGIGNSRFVGFSTADQIDCIDSICVSQLPGEMMPFIAGRTDCQVVDEKKGRIPFFTIYMIEDIAVFPMIIFATGSCVGIYNG